MKAENLEDLYRLSPLQQGILFHTLYSPKSGVYIEQSVFTAHGDFHISAYERAWQTVIDRHPILRTSFFWEGLDNALQVVQQAVKMPITQYDWRGLSSSEQQDRMEAFLKEDQSRGFELSNAPLMRIALILQSNDTYQIVWSRHHLLLDRWSRSLVLQELLAFYDAYRQGNELHLEKSRPYGDYIEWLQQQDTSQAEAFWRQTLKGFTSPTPIMVDGTPGNSHFAERIYSEKRIRLSTETTAGLQSLARQHRLTLNTVLQGAWALLLSRYSAEEDVVFGATVSGRSADLTGVESMVGLFLNTLPVRIQVRPESSVLSWLKPIQDSQVDLREYEYSTLIDIQGWSDVPRGLPLFESILVFENIPATVSFKAAGGNSEIYSAGGAGARTDYPLTILILPSAELTIDIVYDLTRFSPDVIARMLEHFRIILEGIATSPSLPLSHLPLLTDAEQEQILVEWNDTQTDYPQESTIHQLFEEQVLRTPDAVAVVYDNKQLTYQELNEKANQLAHHLQALGVGPEVLVGISMERSLEMVIGLLGILKSGGAYVPLDPDYPQERFSFMLEDSAVGVLLTQERLVASLPESDAQIICLDRDWQLIAANSVENPDTEISSDNLCYVIYTSGSTGRPKGAMNIHRGLCNRLLWMQQAYQLTSSDRVLQKTPFSFDVSVWEFFWPLITGACLVVAEPGGPKDSAYLVRLINEQDVTTLHFVPSMLRAFLDEPTASDCTKLKRVICSGEALPLDLQERFFERLNVELHNLYGPTEASIDVTSWACERNSQLQVVPIGRPIANTEIYIVDRHPQPVPVGVAGELYIGGDGLARGYLNRAELTSEKFIANPFSDDPTARLYKTGDLARYLADGNIEFLGRIDHQVKVRGYRIELGEIESVLNEHPGVSESVVVAREDEPGDKRLVAYLVGSESETPALSELRSYLKEKLPKYMVPSSFVTLERIPLTVNGKVDRLALPAPEETRPELEEAYVAPRSALEDVIAGIWADVLRVERVGVDDNFFELGGHSLNLTKVLLQVQDALQVKVPLRTLFEEPTVGQLAKEITRVRPEINQEIAQTIRELKQLSGDEVKRMLSE